MRTVSALMLFVTGCYAAHAVDGGGSTAPAALVDVDPDPAVVAVELVAGLSEAELMPGLPAPVWAYRDGAVPGSRGTVPGPLLEADEGDLVIVRFRNELPVETTIHWHGIRLDAMFDGTPSSQRPVPPGGTFEYRFVARDPGFYWYHPHVEGEVQIERGLHAPLLVRGGTEVPVTRERVIVLDDAKLEADGTFSERTAQLDLMMGRQGNVLLANGRSDLVLATEAGARERWWLVNVANGRFFRLRIPDRSFIVLGADGGLHERPRVVDELLMAPGERYDILVEVGGATGEVIPVETIHYDRGHRIPDPGPRTVFRLRVGPPVGAPLPPVPEELRAIDRLPVDATTTVRRFVLTEHMEGDEEPEFFINGRRWPDGEHTHVVLGRTEVWEIVNDAEMDHPFHLHGMFFQVLERDGLPEPHVEWKDTVIVPMMSTLRFAVTYDAPGMWMYHCHILEHAERGMMGHLEVAPHDY